ncbi:hypothetical protein OZX68_03435 [Streptococcaceae bacterium ESL0729]|nr:hypothetical protein OZX68_03435 [Streptococcaceae bacterium ESL0729]
MIRRYASRFNLERQKELEYLLDKISGEVGLTYTVGEGEDRVLAFGIQYLESLMCFGQWLNLGGATL